MTEDKPAVETPDAQKLYMLDQQEVNYVPVSVVPGKACSSCCWFIQGYGEDSDLCRIVTNWDMPIVSNGYCDRHETKPRPVELDAEPIPVVIVEPEFVYDDSTEMALSVPKSIFQRVKEFAATLLPRTTPEPAAFTVFKTANGRNAWVARHTGKFIDREDEILSEKSHERYVERVQKGIVAMPELWMWHAKGTRHGQAVAVWKSGGFVLAAGLFDDNAVGERAFRYYQKNGGKIKLSHMFHYPRETKLNGVYNEYNTVEITTLPDGAEAFPYTSFEEIQTMALPEQARSMIGEALGADVLQAALAADSKAETDTKTLEGQGVAFKGYDKYDESKFIAPSEKIAGLEAAQKATDTVIQNMGDVQGMFKALNDSIKLLGDKLETELAAKADLLGKINELESKQALLTDLKPPASQSTETLLADREKSFLDTVMEAAKTGDQPSLIDTLMGSKPTIHS